MELSRKGQELIKMYESMASDGYERIDGSKVESAYNDFEARKFKDDIKFVLKQLDIKTLLDYGCGGSNWNTENFVPSGKSAKEFFELEHVNHYEPARSIDERTKSDCVLSFDVLEHIYINDVANVLREIFSYANKLVILNVACYAAAAKLPNGENAHITVRHPLWWKGVLDVISTEYPDIAVFLICSTGYNKAEAFQLWSSHAWDEEPNYVINF